MENSQKEELNKRKKEVKFVAIDVNTKYSPFITLYKPSTGNVQVVRVTKDYFKEKPIEKYDTLYLADVTPKNRRKKVDGKWTISDEVDYFITYYIVK